MVIRNFTIATFLIFVVLLFAGCAQQKPSCQTGMEPQCIALRQSYINTLMKQNIKIADFDSNIEIVIPADQLFNGVSYSLRNKKAERKLDYVAALLKTYPRSSIKVIGYTDNVQSPDLNKKLSYQQAKQVAGYLWTNGAPTATQKLHFFGMGSKPAIAKGKHVYSQRQNRRIEIWVNRQCGKCSK